MNTSQTKAQRMNKAFRQSLGLYVLTLVIFMLVVFISGMWVNTLQWPTTWDIALRVAIALGAYSAFRGVLDKISKSHRDKLRKIRYGLDA